MADKFYLIRKGSYYYRPNCQGYTADKNEAGRYTLEEAIRESHPNGPDGPRDGMSYEVAPALSIAKGLMELVWEHLTPGDGPGIYGHNDLQAAIEKTGIAKFIEAIRAAAPNGETVSVRLHANGDWSVYDRTAPAADEVEAVVKLKPQYPDYASDPDGLARFRNDVRTHRGHDMAVLNHNSLGRLIDTIDRLRLERDSAIAALQARSAEPAASAWIVGNGSGTAWRTWENGMPTWTKEREHATRYARRSLHPGWPGAPRL